MNDKAKSQTEAKVSKADSLLKIEIWFPDDNVFEVELPATLTVTELMRGLAQHFNLDQKQWSLFSSEGRPFADNETVRDIVGNSEEVRLKRLRVIPKPAWG
jgi:hypothetical protein